MTVLFNMFVVYDLATGEQLAHVKDAYNLDDPTWISFNGHTNHGLLHIHHETYNGFNPDTFADHCTKHIPLHQEWHKTYGHKYKTQAEKKAAFEEHLK